MIRIRFKVKVRVGMVLGLRCGLLHQYSGGVRMVWVRFRVRVKVKVRVE